jgi:NAD(P)H-flavin reductase/hemoglobin-like flavoprotein
VLFVENPELRGMFPLAMDTQRDRLVSALLAITQHIDRPEILVPYLEQLAADHRKFDVKPEHFDAVGRALIAALRRFAGSLWSPEVESAWVQTYGFIARTMVAGVEKAARLPAWWEGEIVAHERRTNDIAVITVRTDQPFAYRPGQYVSLETPWFPGVWRPYSMANAPRADGLIQFHVKAISVGWVSSALVRKAQPGQVIRLGAPVGSMVIDPASPRDVLCVAGGTGLAPIKAIVEDLARWNSPRSVYVFFGARRPHELYDLAAMRRLSSRFPQLTVITAVSDDTSFHGERGLLPDVVARYGPWHTHDIFASGSPPMITATLNRLLTLGVPQTHIRYDAFGEG